MKHQRIIAAPTLGFTETALAVMAGDDAAAEDRAKERGWLKPGESYGYRVINRNITNGSPASDGPIHRTRIDALIAAHTDPTPGFVFERVEVVRTAFEGRKVA